MRGDEAGQQGGVILYEWFATVVCPRRGSHAPPYSASQFGPVCWVRLYSSWPQQYFLWWLFSSPISLSIHFSEFVLWVFEPGKTAGSTITNGNGSHRWTVYSKKKCLLWLNVKLPSASFICCLSVLVVRDTWVVIAYRLSPCLSLLVGSIFTLAISFLDQCVLV